MTLLFVISFALSWPTFAPAKTNSACVSECRDLADDTVPDTADYKRYEQVFDACYDKCLLSSEAPTESIRGPAPVDPGPGGGTNGIGATNGFAHTKGNNSGATDATSGGGESRDATGEGKTTDGVFGGGDGNGNGTANGNGTPTGNGATNGNQDGKGNVKATDNGNGNSTENENTSSLAVEPPCVEDFSSEIEACELQQTKTSDACDENSSALSNVSNLISQASIYMGQKSASSIIESCSKMATFSKGVSAGLMGYRLYCKNAINACIPVCQITLIPKCTTPTLQNNAIIANAKKSLSRGRSECTGFTRKMDEAAAASQNYAEITMNAKDCASLTAGAGEKPTELCLTNPEYPGCGGQEKMDCSNPKMADTKVCVCRANPNHSMCRSSEASNEQTMNAYMADRASKQRDNKNYDLNGQNKIQQAKRPQTGADNSIDGRQGGDVNLASRTSSSTAVPQKTSKGKKTSDRSVLGGFYGGSTSGKLEKNETVPLPTEEKKKRDMASDESENDEQKVLSDLEKFLPGGSMAPRRNITGTDVFYREDGITGPNSDIWGKVKNRYEAVKATLLP